MMYVIIYVIAINLLACGIFAWDKRQAKQGGVRIPEKQLLFIAFIGGATGAYAGMKLFRHKTKKMKFSAGVPILLLIQWVICIFIMKI